MSQAWASLRITADDRVPLGVPYDRSSANATVARSARLDAKATDAVANHARRPHHRGGLGRVVVGCPSWLVSFVWWVRAGGVPAGSRRRVRDDAVPVEPVSAGWSAAAVG